MLLEIREDDPRPRSVQGLEDIMPENVERLRTCVFTNLDFSSIDFRNVNIHVPARLKNPVQINNWRFSNGKLICRRVWIVELHPTANPCGGEAGPLRKREVADLNGDSLPQKSYTVDSTGENSLTDAISSSDDSRVSSDQKRKAESADDQPNFLGKRLRQIPQKSRQFVLGDGFCGGGGASLGARDAGYKIAWGLEKDSLAMAAYRKNFPEAMHLEMDAHDFPSIARRCTHGCDHLHMSCPCCYWSRLQ
jgi:DNA (cytosine-5)-methyltransferase 1